MSPAPQTPTPSMPPQLCACESCTLYRVNRGFAISAEAGRRHASKVAAIRRLLGGAA